MRICFIIFILIVIQGIVGGIWLKVLVNDITVSHYRLSVHLINAILIISMIYWLLKTLKVKMTSHFLDF